MNINDYRKVQSIMGEIEQINKEINFVTSGGPGLDVTIYGKYQGMRMVEHVRPVVLRVLNSELLAKIDALRELGVTVPDDEVPKLLTTDADRYQHLKKFFVQHPDELAQGEQLYFGTYPAGELDAEIDKDIARRAEAAKQQLDLLPP